MATADRAAGDAVAGDVVDVTSPWAHPPYRPLFYSSVMTVYAVMGQNVARAWLARELTGSNAGLGGVWLAFGGAMLLATPWGGVAADRFSKRTVLQVALVVLAASSGALGVAVILDALHYWMLLAVSSVQAAAFAFYMPARISFVGQLVSTEAIGNGVVLMQASQESMRIVSTALAGLLIGVSGFGSGGVFFLASGLMVAACTMVSRLPATERRSGPQPSPFADMRDALQYVRTTRGLTRICVTTIVVVMIGQSFQTFLPAMADDFGLGAAGYGLLSAAVGLGALVAGWVTVRSGGRRRPWRMFPVSGAAFGVGLIGLGLSGSAAPATVTLVVIGASSLLFQTTGQSLLLTMSHFEYHGRLQSIVVLGMSGFGLVALPLGFVGDSIGIAPTLLMMGGVVGAAVVAFAYVHVRERRRLVQIEL